MEVRTLSQQLLFSTVRIETISSRGISRGTSFIFNYEWAEGRAGDFLVTNKHVVQGFKKGSFFFTRKSIEGDAPLIGQRFDIEMTDFEDSWTGHPDPEIDIAVMPLVPLINELKRHNVSVYTRSVGQDLIPNEDDLKDIDALEEIVFVGYPNGLFDSANLLPLFRRGITASPIQMNYDGKPIFYIDASVFGGSSGSPVFIYNPHGHIKGNTFIFDPRLHFVGVIAAVAVNEIEGSIQFRDIPTSLTPIVSVSNMLDLGLVYKASTVVEAVKACLNKHGETVDTNVELVPAVGTAYALQPTGDE